MKEKVKNPNNLSHLYGYINGVRVNEMENGRTAINLDVVTLEQFKREKEGKTETRRTYHDVALFTEDKEVIKAYKAIAADVENNKANRNVEGFEPKTHTISVDGILVNKKDSKDLQLLATVDNIALDVKQAEKEVRNSAKIVGNVAAIRLEEDKKFAVVTLIHHYRPEGAEKEFATTIDVRVNGDRKVGAPTYEQILKGELAKGDFVRMGGQLHNNSYTPKDSEEKRYTMVIDLTSSEILKHKEAVKEEVKEEKKPEKATSRKKGSAVKM